MLPIDTNLTEVLAMIIQAKGRHKEQYWLVLQATDAHKSTYQRLGLIIAPSFESRVSYCRRFRGSLLPLEKLCGAAGEEMESTIV
jgi:hypothetical protein